MKQIKKIFKKSTESEFSTLKSILDKSTENYTQSQLNRIDENKSIDDLKIHILENVLNQYYNIDNVSDYINKMNNNEDIIMDNGDTIPVYDFEDEVFSNISSPSLLSDFDDMIEEFKIEFKDDNIEWNKENLLRYIAAIGSDWYIV